MIVTLLYPSIDARIADLREAVADLPADSALRARLEARIDDLVVAANEVPGDLGGAAPALEKWRREVFAASKSARPLERAAAWELTALELERVGDPNAAAQARRFAATALCEP